MKCVFHLGFPNFDLKQLARETVAVLRVQIWRTDWVPVLADAPQPGLRVKIWGRGFGPRLADVQLNVSVALDILKYDSRIFLDN